MLRWDASFIHQNIANIMYTYEHIITSMIEGYPTAPPLKDMVILEGNVEVLEPLNNDDAIHVEDDQTYTKDEDYKYLILNPKYYKKGTLFDKGKGILQNKYPNAKVNQ